MSEANPPVDPHLSADPNAEDPALAADVLDPETGTDATPDPLNQALMEAAQWKDAAHRAAAELDNYRKRTARDLQETVKYANANLLESLLPVLDNFDYGMAAAKAESEGSNLYIGLSMVLRQVQDFLKDNGVEEIAAVGSAFDPHLHEAVSQQPSPSVPEGTVLSQTRKGYKLRDRLLRPASVIVSSGPATDAPSA
ncbi:MAG: grpE [Verrucomicrobiales bacterium]|nr:grpE [Verrucomicrobiales bacterium]